MSISFIYRCQHITIDYSDKSGIINLTLSQHFGPYKALSWHAVFAGKPWITLQTLKEENKRWQWPGGKVQDRYNKDPLVRTVDTIPPKASIPERSGDKHSLQPLTGKILATLTEEGENEGLCETLSTGNSKQIHRHEWGRREGGNVRSISSF